MKNKLTITLEGDRTIVMQRMFNAPRELVFDAWTMPEHLAQWYGMQGSTLTECRVDLRPGGSCRMVIRESNGEEYGFGGRYMEVLWPERLVHTYLFDPYPEDEAMVTVIFETMEGGTLLTETTVHVSAEGREGHIASGFEVGATGSMERLEALLVELQHHQTAP
jgi:uncharacterized protein YndB with AHSA1/START domain